MTQHTPGPYLAIGNQVTAIDHGERFTIASCATSGRWKHTPEGEADNAAFVALACNSHADLLAALVALFENCAMIHKYGGEISNQREADAAIKAARAAIQKATTPTA